MPCKKFCDGRPFWVVPFLLLCLLFDIIEALLLKLFNGLGLIYWLLNILHHFMGHIIGGFTNFACFLFIPLFTRAINK